MFVSGKEITGSEIHPLIELFYMCSQMKWAHLPLPGGLSDQHPEVYDIFLYIFVEKNKADEKERQRESQKNRSNKR